MMEFETWNRETLINEIKTAMPLAYTLAMGNFMGLPVKPKLYSDKELLQKTDYALKSLYVELKHYDKDFRKEYEENEEKKRFFNQSASNADFSYWSRQAYWSINEAIALILGKDPRKVTWDEVKKHIPNSPFANKFNELKELASRYVICKELFDPVFPGIFLAWSERMNIPVPVELKEAVREIGVQISDWKSNYEKVSAQYSQLDGLYTKSLGLMKVKDEIIETLKLKIAKPVNEQPLPESDSFKETERQSVFKLLATMAYDGYGYNAMESKSPLPKELSDAVTTYLGEKIDTDTSRKWLKKASSMYPNQISSKTE